MRLGLLPSHYEVATKRGRKCFRLVQHIERQWFEILIGHERRHVLNAIQRRWEAANHECRLEVPSFERLLPRVPVAAKQHKCRYNHLEDLLHHYHSAAADCLWGKLSNQSGLQTELKCEEGHVHHSLEAEGGGPRLL